MGSDLIHCCLVECVLLGFGSVHPKRYKRVNWHCYFFPDDAVVQLQKPDSQLSVVWFCHILPSRYSGERESVPQKAGGDPGRGRDIIKGRCTPRPSTRLDFSRGFCYAPVCTVYKYDLPQLCAGLLNARRHACLDRGFLLRTVKYSVALDRFNFSCPRLC